MEKTVREERTGWRDLELNERHRQWGWDCPAFDLDCLFLEYDKGKAAAIVEYKHENAKEVNTAHPTIRALVDLGDRADIPAFVVRYKADFSKWKVTPLNAKAKSFIAKDTVMFEKDWVRLLYKIRGYELPEEVEFRLI